MTMPKVHAPDLSQLFSVAGKNVLITGGTGGLGTMFATTFLAAGARVWITGRKADALAAAREELSALGPVETLEGDLATVEGVKAIIEGFQAQADRLHVLITHVAAQQQRAHLLQIGWLIPHGRLRSLGQRGKLVDEVLPIQRHDRG